MRFLPLIRRWHRQGPPVSPPWRRDPWISASRELPDARMQAAGEAAASRQHKAAIGTWEEEGGSIRTGVLRL
jgi:hypothetical protein